MSPSNSRGFRYPFLKARSTNRLYRIGVNLSLTSFDLTPGWRVAVSLSAAPAAPSPIAPTVTTPDGWIRVLLASHAWSWAPSTRAVKLSDERRFAGWDNELGGRGPLIGHASDGTGSHEPEEDRGAEARSDKPKAGDDHAFADEVPEIRADHEQEHERDDDRGDRRVSKVEEGERDDREEGGQQRGDPVDQRAQDRRELERLLVFLAEPREHRPLDRADVEFLLDAFRFVGADRAADRCGEDQRLVRLRCADRVRADDDPEDREGSVERTDHEVATDDRPDIRDFVVLPNSATPGPEIHVIRSGSQVSRGWSVRVARRRPGPVRGSGSSPGRSPAFPLPCRGIPARPIARSRRRRRGRRARGIRRGARRSAPWPTISRSLEPPMRSPSTSTS